MVKKYANLVCITPDGIGLDELDFKVISIVNDKPGVSMKEIYKISQVNVTYPTIINRCKRLDSLGYLKKSSDGKLSSMHLTPMGKKLLKNNIKRLKKRWIM